MICVSSKAQHYESAPRGGLALALEAPPRSGQGGTHLVRVM